MCGQPKETFCIRPNDSMDLSVCNTQDNTPPRMDFRAGHLPTEGGTHNKNCGFLGICCRAIFVDASLSIYTLPIVDRTSFEVRPEVVCVILRVMR